MSLLKFSALGAIAVIAAATPASAGTFAAGSITKTDAAVIKVHDNGDRRQHRYYRHYRDDVVVDAPTTYVETHGRRTWVDAPFTAVRVHPRGVWVRAPFVNIYVPR